MSERLLTYSDGGARGNPGPAAIAFIAQDEQGKILKEDSCYLGIRTNNQAEYEALLLALRFAIRQKVREVVCHLDSELVAKQLRGEYAVKNYELQQLWLRVQELKVYFRRISFVCLPRSNTRIQRADALVNKTLDEEALKPFS
jgi:ribonuclease HI